MLLPLVLLFVGVVLLPLPAFAFGPAVHIDTGLQVLANAGGLALGVGALLRRHKIDFLRGCLAPDRALAKNLAPYPRHTHNWERVVRLLDGASDEGERAFFLGYMCHLAADVVSHNYFLPVRMVHSPLPRIGWHAYWEMRFDARVKGRLVPETMRSLHMDAREHRRFLAEILPPSPVAAPVNIGIAGFVMQLQRFRAFRSASEGLDRASRLVLGDEEVADVRALAIAAQLAALDNPRGAAILAIDPRGLASMKLGKRLRRGLIAMDGPGLDQVVVPDSMAAFARTYFRDLVTSVVPDCAAA